MGDRYLQRAKRLRTRLGKIPAKSDLARQLICYAIEPELEGFPSELLSYYPESAVEKDTFHDWLFLVENKIRSHMPMEVGIKKYHY